MSEEESSKDFICMLVGLAAAIISTAGVFAINYFWHSMKEVEKKIQKSSTSDEDDGNKVLKFKPLPKQSSIRNNQKPNVNDDKHSQGFSMIPKSSRKNARDSPISMMQSLSGNQAASSASAQKEKEVEATLDIRKGVDGRKDLVNLNIIVDPESKDPLNIHVEAKVDEKTMDVQGRAETEAEGTVKIEGQMENSGIKDQKEMNLNLKRDSSDSDEMNLNAVISQRKKVMKKSKNFKK